MQEGSTSVLVVGGGLVGLSAAVFLAWRGIPTVLVEKHPGSALHPRALGFRTRTMELYRAVGLGPAIPQAPRSAGNPRRVRAESLAGKWYEEAAWTQGRPAAEEKAVKPAIEYSPCTGGALAQDALEPILRSRAIELGADIRPGTELTSFEQDADGVTVSLRGPGGRESATRYSLPGTPPTRSRPSGAATAPTPESRTSTISHGSSISSSPGHRRRNCSTPTKPNDAPSPGCGTARSSTAPTSPRSPETPTRRCRSSTTTRWSLVSSTGLPR
jgi:glycine/D-amino acid oxidase-like deaminating enzyme